VQLETTPRHGYRLRSRTQSLGGLGCALGSLIARFGIRKPIQHHDWQCAICLQHWRLRVRTANATAEVETPVGPTKGPIRLGIDVAKRFTRPSQ